MKILITYFSNTGNTKKVAYSIKEGLSDENIEIKPVQDVDPSSLSSYDLIFLGSGVYASRINNKVVNLIKKAPKLPSKFAYFYTHASLKLYQKPFEKVTTILKEKGCQIVGEFDCVGENLGIPKEKQLEMLNNLPEDQKKKAKEDMEKIKGHPNEEDLEKARKFASSLMKSI